MFLNNFNNKIHSSTPQNLLYFTVLNNCGITDYLSLTPLLISNYMFKTNHTSTVFSSDLLIHIVFKIEVNLNIYIYIYVFIVKLVMGHKTQTQMLNLRVGF